jgi:hypothetical protein
MRNAQGGMRGILAEMAGVQEEGVEMPRRGVHTRRSEYFARALADLTPRPPSLAGKGVSSSGAGAPPRSGERLGPPPFAEGPDPP